MPFTVEKIIHDLVDWSHDEIVALEAHLGVHPNRKGAPERSVPVLISDGNRQTPAELDASMARVLELEGKVRDANAAAAAAAGDLDSLKGQLKAATDTLVDVERTNEELNAKLAGATNANTELQQQVADLQAAVDASTEGQDKALQAAADENAVPKTEAKVDGQA